MVGNKAAQRARRKEIRKWVEDSSRKQGGYWYAATVPEKDHGEVNTYNNWYCRCTPCTSASTRAKQLERQKRWEERVWVEPYGGREGYWYAPKAPEHGLYSTHRNWGCHCPPCKEAERKEQESREENSG